MASSSDSKAKRGFVPPQNTDEKLLQRRIADAVKAVSATGRPRFTAFLNDREIQLATAQLNKLGWREYCFEGGFDGAERKMLCVFEDSPPAVFPITQLNLCASGQGLTHRDYLGALMGLNIKRECTGDILVDGCDAILYLQDTVAPLVCDELREVGRYSVKLSESPPDASFQPEGASQQASATVPSLRLDAVLAAMLHLSRRVAAEMVQRGDVQVNHIAATRPDSHVCEGDVFSLRGTGKYRLDSIGGASRKNRTFIHYTQY